MKMVFGILIIVASVILIATLAPPFFSNYQFEDAFKTESQMTTYTTKTEDVIRDEVFKKAQELDVPVTKEQIKVVRNGVVGTGSVEIEAAYTVHVNLPGYPMDLNFDPSSTKQGRLLNSLLCYKLHVKLKNRIPWRTFLARPGTCCAIFMASVLLFAIPQTLISSQAGIVQNSVYLSANQHLRQNIGSGRLK